MKSEPAERDPAFGRVPYILPWDDAPLDISFLFTDEKPAGKHGFLAVHGDQFAFEDGTRARFWGTCFNSAANFPSHDDSEKVARRLAKFGVNMVRTHQMDAEWSTPNIFQFTRGERKDNTLEFNPQSMDRLDYLIHCLKREGIYIYLDQLTYRSFKDGDGVDSPDELVGGARPYTNFDPRLIALQKKYSHDLWTHVNPYTSLAYKDDPAIALMEIVNENDTLSSSLITVEPYRTRLEAQYRAWAKEKGISLAEDRIDFADRTEPLIRFLHNVQVRYYTEMIAYLRSIGVRIPIAGGNWNTGLAGLSSYACCDFCDTHLYWDMWSDTTGTNKLLMEQKHHWAHAAAKYRLLDRPFFVSEWDAVWPNEWRAESPLMIAALAALQDWSGMTIHTYRYRSTGPVDRMGGVIMGGIGYRLNFDTFNDPAKFGLFYHAALLFRRGDVAPAQSSLAIKVTDRDIFESRSRDFPSLLPAAEEHKAGIVLPGQQVEADKVFGAEDATAERDERRIISDTGEQCRDLDQKISWIDTPRTKAAYGFLGSSKTIELKGLRLKVKTPFAVIALSSLTQDPIENSPNLLLTTVGRADNAGARYNADHTERLDIGHEPVLIESIEAEVELVTAQPGLRVMSIGPEGFITGKVSSRYENGQLQFELGTQFPSLYYLLQR